MGCIRYISSETWVFKSKCIGAFDNGHMHVTPICSCVVREGTCAVVLYWGMGEREIIIMAWGSTTCSVCVHAVSASMYLCNGVVIAEGSLLMDGRSPSTKVVMTVSQQFGTVEVSVAV